MIAMTTSSSINVKARIRRCQKMCTRFFLSLPARNAIGTNPKLSQK